MKTSGETPRMSDSQMLPCAQWSTGAPQRPLERLLAAEYGPLHAPPSPERYTRAGYPDDTLESHQKSVLLNSRIRIAQMRKLDARAFPPIDSVPLPDGRTP